MIIILRPQVDQQQLDNLKSWLKNQSLDIHMSEGAHSTIMGLVGDTSTVDINLLRALDIVEDVKRIQEPYKRASRKFHPNDTVITIGAGKGSTSTVPLSIGGGNFTISFE